MPWQHLVVAADFALSIILIMAWAPRGYYQRTPLTALFWGVWDTAVLALLMTGATEFTWQITVIAMLYIANIPQAIIKGFQRKREEITENTVIGGYIIFAILMTLLLTGQPG